MRAEARTAARRTRGAAARLSGRRREVLAAILLMLKGYRVLGFRLRTPQGELDLVAVKRRVLAVVEVKSRGSIEAALEAVGPPQRERLRRAGRELAARRPGLKGLSVRLDLMAFAKDAWPRHIADAWSDDSPG
ncbi:MAG TPA: YraN family protein [Caulobacteraceae bacterium]|jgi:putative endonuclease